jgi:hypothetical protein
LTQFFEKTQFFEIGVKIVNFQLLCSLFGFEVEWPAKKNNIFSVHIFIRSPKLANHWLSTLGKKARQSCYTKTTKHKTKLIKKVKNVFPGKNFSKLNLFCQ